MKRRLSGEKISQVTQYIAELLDINMHVIPRKQMSKMMTNFLSVRLQF